jgi:hypothetical protein
VTVGRPLFFHDLSVGETAAPSLFKGRGECGGGRTPPQISRRKDQAGRPGIEEKISQPFQSGRHRAKAWGSLKGRIFRINITPSSAAARVAFCMATAHWNPQPSVPADRREGRVQRRSRCGLKKSAMPSLLTKSIKEKTH